MDTKELFLSSLSLPGDLKNLKYKDLEIVAKETRDLIIDVTSKNGGHIAPSLGVVELTIAILRKFDLSKDKVVWDVGHQSYAYKILTDRLHSFHTLRQYGGISGFLRPEESPYDTTISGHASTSISSVVGITHANTILGHKGKAVAVIGDGALTGGIALEALNNLSTMKENVIIILNDNEMSISNNVGGLSSYLSRSLTSEVATKFKHDIENIFEDAPLGDKFISLAKRMEKMFARAFSPGAFFESIGIRYIGPINGHKIKDIEKALSNAKLQKGPVVVHLNTIKGKGYEHAEKSPDIFHGVPSFDKSTGIALSKSTSLSWTGAYGAKLLELAEKNKNIVAITAAMMDGTGLKDFAKKYPKRFFDVGIAEQHAVTFAAGLAIGGAKPYCTIYSTFLQRAYDQIIHDVAIPQLPVTLCIDRGGFVGADGSTHHGLYDISYLRTIPNLNIMLPKDKFELESMLELSYKMNRPVSIRYARGNIFIDESLPKNDIELGVPEIIYKGSDIAIISVGHIFEEVINVYRKLINDNYSVSLINLRFIKPLNTEYLINELKNKSLIVTVEEGTINGGAGEMVLSILNNYNIDIPVLINGVPDEFIEHGNISDLRKDIGLDSVSLYLKIKDKVSHLGIKRD